jgi:peptidoglycan lytic transglycosylase
VRPALLAVAALASCRPAQVTPPPPQGHAYAHPQWAPPHSPQAAHTSATVAPTVGSPPVPPPVMRPAPFQRGKASYYADSLAGNPTASGEAYDPTQLTAAHRKLAFGTVVDVVRDDGRSVRVRITDRGPFAKGRVIDLSRRAAEAIGMIQAGVVNVTLYVITSP